MTNFRLHEPEYFDKPIEQHRVCCNCAHCIRGRIPIDTRCYCEVDERYLGYISVMEGWCSHWKSDKEKWSEKDEK